jgi:hypothetical protein
VVSGQLGVNVLTSTGDYPFPSDNGTLFAAGDDGIVRRENNRIAQIDGVARAAARLPGRRVLLGNFSFLRRNKGLPAGGSVRSLDASLGSDRLIGSAQFESRDDLGPGGRLHAQVYTVWGEQRLTDEKGEISFFPTRTRDRIVTMGATVLASKPVGERVRLSAMLEGRKETFAPRDELAPQTAFLPGRRGAATAGGEADVLLAPLGLQVIPSIRVEAARDESVEFFSAAGEAEEAVEIARRVRILAELGARFDEIAILLRDPDIHQGLIEEALERGRYHGRRAAAEARRRPPGS